MLLSRSLLVYTLIYLASIYLAVFYEISSQYLILAHTTFLSQSILPFTLFNVAIVVNKGGVPEMILSIATAIFSFVIPDFFDRCEAFRLLNYVLIGATVFINEFRPFLLPLSETFLTVSTLIYLIQRRYNVTKALIIITGVLIVAFDVFETTFAMIYAIAIISMLPSLRIKDSMFNTSLIFLLSSLSIITIAYNRIGAESHFNVQNLIVGAGPTGLGAALEFYQQDKPFLLIESQSHAGGLAASKEHQGFTWDFGGHVLFSHYEYFDEVLNEVLGDDQLRHDRQAYVYLQKREVPYPFQNNIWRLDKPDRDAIVKDLEEVSRNKKSATAKNYEQWLRSNYGNALCEIFMFPYNEKVWAYPAYLMSSSWVGERVAKVDIKAIKHNIKHQQDALGWGPNNQFIYPTHRGIGEIFTRIAELIPTKNKLYNTRLVSVDAANHIAHFRNSTHRFSVTYQNFVSTIPVTKLIEMTEIGIKSSLQAAKQGLMHSSTNVIGIGIKGNRPENLKKKCWFYYPEAQFPFYRVTVLSNYSPNMAPEDHWSLMAEVSESVLKYVDHHKLIQRVIDGLIEADLIRESDIIVSKFLWTEEHGYPTPSLRRDESLEEIHKTLTKYNIFSRGRFGGWKYEVGNMDHSFMQGTEIARFLITEEPELTYFSPDFVNSKKNSGKFELRK